jgi:hypothetical protein
MSPGDLNYTEGSDDEVKSDYSEVRSEELLTPPDEASQRKVLVKIHE